MKTEYTCKVCSTRRHRSVKLCPSCSTPGRQREIPIWVIVLLSLTIGTILTGLAIRDVYQLEFGQWYRWNTWEDGSFSLGWITGAIPGTPAHSTDTLQPVTTYELETGEIIHRWVDIETQTACYWMDGIHTGDGLPYFECGNYFPEDD